MQQLSNTGTLSSLSVLTRAATARAQIEKETGATSKVVQVARIRVKPQVRHDFSDIADFAERLKVVGHVHTPVLLREIKGEADYELIAGERRVRGSILNGWAEIPAKVFPADTPDLKLRMYQVSENIDRKGLNLKETAIGLAADVERFGREEAARIWAAPNGKQRSASWVSKHLRFQKYGPITRELFDANLFDDIEAANKMDDIEGVSADVAAEIAAEMREGRKIGRLTFEARLNTLRQPGPLLGDAPASPLGATVTSVQETALEPASPTPAVSAAAAEVRTVEASSELAVHTAPELCDAAVGGSDDSAALRSNPPARPRQQRVSSADPKNAVVWRVEEIYETGTGAIERLRSLQRDLAAAGVSPEDTEWRLYVAFVDLAGSALVGIGPETAGRILNRFNAELNSRGPLELLNRLHRSRKTGVLPDDFGYDTEREIHPLAPGNWTL
ncbi:ParB/RepB/Spo0J family partition protein [Burkholderia multivorans]|uniref:ParB/RepB/Spo0J family partition protein n=1 Tax=Burkholderia multivorans TaxID=87883 RepID=UPI00158B3674|nr:ParB N-terminal domain-containing protein [Burkholderia multivorans]